MTNLFAAVKKSVKKPKENKYTAETPESEMKVSLRISYQNLYSIFRKSTLKVLIWFLEILMHVLWIKKVNMR